MEIAVNVLTQTGHLGFIQILHPNIGINLGSGQNLFTGAVADPIDIGQRNYNPLVSGNVNAGDTRHNLFSLLPKPVYFELVLLCLTLFWMLPTYGPNGLAGALALALLVLGVGTDHIHNAPPPHNLALFTHPLNRWSDLHGD